MAGVRALRANNNGLRQQSDNAVALKNKNTKAPAQRAALKNITNVNREAAPQQQRKAERKPLTRHNATSGLVAKPAPTVEAWAEPEKVEPAPALQPTIGDEDMDLASEMLDNLDVEDIDTDDALNPLLCAEYVKDIYKYMNKLETNLQATDYMEGQSEINQKMRSILVDWLIQVQSRFNLLQETLYLTVYIIDRYLTKVNVSRSELQLVGVTAMLLASKYEEMYAPEIGDFVYITDNAYTKQKIRTTEQTMLKALDYDISNPLCLHFLRRNSKAGGVDAQKHILAKYLMELTLVDYELARKLPSEIAAAALYLSIKLIDGSEWTACLDHYSGYTEAKMKPTICQMAKQVVKIEAPGCKYQAVKSKYAANKFMRISRLPELKGSLIKELAEQSTST